ncbi:hypothetical protein F2Q69_00023228 [Brassica cretica]|uniref:Uncharacterized protein n=1 Tax=Brassica cretica TaxID=69181 RepID=A0A8S9Q8U6_BRACR|nr:hypothetical protein F2Q69_00023227 [Brassica cretica]KAF3538207.1 hypothetical protein F2Q69_00023228 [Brassica cretica]
MLRYGNRVLRLTSGFILFTKLGLELVGSRAFRREGEVESIGRFVWIGMESWASRATDRAARYVQVVALLSSGWRINGWLEGTESSTSEKSHRPLRLLRSSTSPFIANLQNRSLRSVPLSFSTP